MAIHDKLKIAKMELDGKNDGSVDTTNSTKRFDRWVDLKKKIRETGSQLGVNLTHSPNDKTYRDPKKILKKMHDDIRKRLLYLKSLPPPVKQSYLKDVIQNIEDDQTVSLVVAQKYDLTDLMLLISHYSPESPFIDVVHRLQTDLKCTVEQARMFLAEAIVNYMESGKNQKVALNKLRAPYERCGRLNEDLVRVLTDQRKEFKKIEDGLALIPSLYEDGYPLVEKKGVFETILTSVDLSSVAYVDGRDSIYCQVTLFLTSEKEYFIFKPAKTCNGNLYEAMSRFKEAYFHFDKRVPRTKYGMRRANQLQLSQKNISNRYNNYDGISSSSGYGNRYGSSGYGDSYGSSGYGDSYGSSYGSGGYGSSSYGSGGYGSSSYGYRGY